MSSDPILITGVGQRIGLHLARTFLGRGVPVIGAFRTERNSLDEFQRTVDYLLESQYVTGRIHHLDGGRHLKP